MEYDSDYKPTMKEILQLIKQEKIPRMDGYSKDIVERLYNYIIAGYKFAKKTVTEDKFKLIPKHKMKYPFRNSFISNEIDNDIRYNMEKQVLFSCNFEGRLVTITIGIMDKFITNEEIIASIRRMVSWIFVCNKYSDSKYCRPLTVDCYFSGIKRDAPTSSIPKVDHSNVNGGLSSTMDDNRNSNIIIYRYEEWFKVFLHECGHSYGHETHNIFGKPLNSLIKKIISIKVSDRIGEAYVETWGRIILVCYNSIENTRSYKEFLSLFKFNMKVESVFSSIQTYRFLSFMNLHYEDIINPLYSRRDEYEETTNLFAYFVLSGAMMNDPFKFLKLCSSINPNMFQLCKNEYAVSEFKKYIKECLYNEQFIDRQIELDSYNMNNQTGLRFTISELPKN